MDAQSLRAFKDGAKRVCLDGQSLKLTLPRRIQ